MSFPQRLADDAALIDARLTAALAGHPDVPVVHAMRYALRGGKRLRGFLALESARLHGLDAIDPAASVEALHAYSLVHDDMPCMDDDDLRRGQPTVHIQWDEATAVLAGDALQTLAFELLTEAPNGLALVAGLARASGAQGMVLGQALDIAAETAEEPLTLEEITRLQAGKTGALISYSAQVGAIMAGADTAPLRAYADALGLAFQIADDILDVIGDSAKAGKRLNKDAAAGKATFVSLLGLDGAKLRARELVDIASAALDPYGHQAEILREAARFVIARES
ncbi:polyprenyl synthetase family protein [Falsirhodobacter xinxiangensis]|uniref:polyprenyl synthetase family protein n=1 Tax=Falsirhodobacter xinxiangensis TaxID=2530049 RepID=UPI0010A9D27C|nr:polyprenyl synthetase family protein [Rhodobacter xinxiangensis]